MPPTRCAKPEAQARLWRLQTWVGQSLCSDVKADAVFASADRCPVCDGGRHGCLTMHATHSRRLDKLAAPRRRPVTLAHKLRRLASLGEHVGSVRHNA